jgi:hypothetical protein
MDVPIALLCCFSRPPQDVAELLSAFGREVAAAFCYRPRLLDEPSCHLATSRHSGVFALHQGAVEGAERLVKHRCLPNHGTECDQELCVLLLIWPAKRDARRDCNRSIHRIDDAEPQRTAASGA